MYNDRDFGQAFSEILQEWYDMIHIGRFFLEFLSMTKVNNYYSPACYQHPTLISMANNLQPSSLMLSLLHFARLHAGNPQFWP